MPVLRNRVSQWLVAMVLLVAVLGGMAALGVAAPIEDAASAVFGPVQRGLRQAAEPVANLVEDIDDFDRVDDENRALRNRIEQLESEVARLREQQIQVRGREALLAVQEAQASEVFVIAEVVTRDLTGLRDVIGINKGSIRLADVSNTVAVGILDVVQDPVAVTIEGQRVHFTKVDTSILVGVFTAIASTVSVRIRIARVGQGRGIEIECDARASAQRHERCDTCFDAIRNAVRVGVY